MRIGLITQWYTPEPASAAHPAAIARALIGYGHDVTVLTGFPNYPLGRVYPGYRMRWRQTETRDGAVIHRVPLYPSHDSSPVRRAATLLSFAASASLQASVLSDVDVCLVYSSPATTAMPAMLLHGLRGKPYVLYIQDLWPDSVTASGFVRRRRLQDGVERLLHRACNAAYRRADGIAVIAPGMRDLLIERGVDDAKVEVVYNWVDESIFGPSIPDPAMLARLRRAGHFWFMYAGGVGELQGLDTAIEALGQLRGRSEIGLVLVGHGVAEEKLKLLAEELGVADRVVFAGGRPMSEMPGVMAAANAQLISLRDLSLFRSTIPSKLQSILACGLPVIACAPGDTAGLVEESGAGLACSPGDASALAAGMVQMADYSVEQRAAMGARGRQFYLARLGGTVGTTHLVGLLRRASSPGSRRMQEPEPS